VHLARTRYEDIVPDRRIVMSATTRDRGRLTSVGVARRRDRSGRAGSRLTLTYQAVLLDGRDSLANR
jgi:hypothetical protein